MPDPGLIEAIKDLGSLGFALIAIWAFATGRVVPGPLHAAALSRIDRLTDAVERCIAALDAVDVRREDSVDKAVNRMSRVLSEQTDDLVKRLRP